MTSTCNKRLIKCHKTVCDSVSDVGAWWPTACGHGWGGHKGLSPFTAALLLSHSNTRWRPDADVILSPDWLLAPHSKWWVMRLVQCARAFAHAINFDWLCSSYKDAKKKKKKSSFIDTIYVSIAIHIIVVLLNSPMYYPDKLNPQHWP